MDTVVQHHPSLGWLHEEAAPSPRATIEVHAGGSAMHLDHGQHLHLLDALGWRVEVTSGTIWITQDGDIRDIVLEPGKALVLERDAPALLYALEDATFRIHRARTQPAAAPARRLLRSLFAARAA